MKTSVEKGLASHSSIMVAPQELSGDNEEGWAVVSSKRTLRRLRKISKKNTARSVGSTSSTSNQEVIQASSDNGSIKSGVPVQIGLQLLRDP